MPKLKLRRIRMKQVNFHWIEGDWSVVEGYVRVKTKATKRPSITGKSTFGHVLKKQKIEDAILILWDESGFSLHPNRRLAWSPIGVTPIRFAVFPKHRPRTRRS